MKTTKELLGEYVREASESAFGEIVVRQIDLVYSTAFRVAGGDAQAAQDITQIVFSDLARKARSVPADTPLAGWLYRHAWFTASKAVRTEVRRRTREMEAMMMQPNQPETGPSWDQIAPLIEGLMNRLEARERNAVTLRFFQNQSYSEVAVELATTEEAARKLVNRALAKLRALLEKRGVRGTSGGLIGSLSGASAVSAPLGLAAKVSSLALASAAVSTGTIPVLYGIMTKLKSVIAASLIVAGTSFTAWQHHQISQLKEQNRVLKQEQAANIGTLNRLPANEVPALGQRIGEGKNRQEFLELLRLRGQVGVLRSQLRIQADNHAAQAAIPAPASNPEASTNGATQLLTASGSARVGAGQTLITGGWLTPAGNRIFVFFSPSLMPSDAHPGELRGRFVEMTEDAANQAGLNQLGVQGTESELAGLYDEAQWRIAMETLKTMAGVHFLSLSSIMAREGEEVEMSMTTDTGAADTYKLKITQLTVPEDRAVDLYFRAQVQPRARPSNLESQGTAGQ